MSFHRLQAAKQEAESIFKDIALGDGVKKAGPFNRKRPREEQEGVQMKRLSKLDKAKAEAMEAFGGASFQSLSKKRKIDKDSVWVIKFSVSTIKQVKKFWLILAKVLLIQNVENADAFKFVLIWGILLYFPLALSPTFEVLQEQSY